MMDYNYWAFEDIAIAYFSAPMYVVNKKLAGKGCLGRFWSYSLKKVIFIGTPWLPFTSASKLIDIDIFHRSTFEINDMDITEAEYKIIINMSS